MLVIGDVEYNDRFSNGETDSAASFWALSLTLNRLDTTTLCNFALLCL